MFNIRKPAAIAAFALLALAPLSAVAASIACPHSQIRREVTTPLPSGWWNTPIVNSLKSTRVQNIGGKPALICDYGAAGTVQRYAPAGQNCVAQGRGFRCQASVSASAPRTFSTGGLAIPQTYLADLDRGTVGSSGADLWFQAQTATRLFVTPQNGAKIAVGNRSNRGFAGCSRAAFSGRPVALNQIPVGSYICVRTNEGRISQFRVNEVSGGSLKTLRLGYTTWR